MIAPRLHEKCVCVCRLTGVNGGRLGGKPINLLPGAIRLAYHISIKRAEQGRNSRHCGEKPVMLENVIKASCT